MLWKRLPCWLCPEERCKTQQSRCMFSWMPECFANIDRAYAQMGYQNKNFNRKRDTWYSAGIYRHWWRTRPKNTPTNWQIWVEEINQTLRYALFDNNRKTRNKARQTFQQHIDNAVSKSHEPQFCITHKCIGEKDQETLKTGIPESLFKEKEPDCLRWVRHKDLCNNIGGGIMFCQDCEQPISITDIVNQSLKRWKDTVIQGARAQDKWLDTNIPPSPERLDMAAYTFSYHMNKGCALESDPVWGHNNVCKTLLKYRFEEHSACHCASCFKKGCKCRLLFQFMPHEDRGDNNKNETLWFCLNGSFNSVYPFMVIPKRPMGWQFINAHNKPILEVFNSNTNIQIGNAWQVFYSTLYTILSGKYSKDWKTKSGASSVSRSGTLKGTLCLWIMSLD